MNSVKKSLSLLEEARKIMYPPTQTIAKGPSQFVEGVSPVFAKKGKDGHIWDVDDNEYIDLNMAVGPVSLGYCFDKVDSAIKSQLEKGITFSLMHHLEYDLSKIINNVIPNAEVVRFSKTGADVCSAAIRVARAYTKKEKIICCGYHGWHDWYISTSSMNSGIPISNMSEVSSVPYNDIDIVKSKIDSNTAAVILEPVLFEKPNPNFLSELLDICNQKGALLIFDEMWTGFRLALGGAQEFFDVVPHLSVFSKACANGMPLSILTGKKEIMSVLSDEVFFYTTFGGEALSLAAAKTTIEIMQNEPVIKTIWENGETLIKGINLLIDQYSLREFFNVSGYPCRSLFNINSESSEKLHLDSLIIKSFIQQIFFENGILWSGFHNLCYTHTTQDIEKTIKTYEIVFIAFKNNISNPQNIINSIKGNPIQPVFRKTKY